MFFLHFIYDVQSLCLPSKCAGRTARFDNHAEQAALLFWGSLSNCEELEEDFKLISFDGVLCGRDYYFDYLHSNVLDSKYSNH